MIPGLGRDIKPSKHEAQEKRPLRYYSTALPGLECVNLSSTARHDDGN